MFSAFQSNAFQSNAWQILTQIAKKVLPEGGGKGSGKKRKKRIYVERKGKIYIFADEYQASAFLQSQEEQQPKKKRVARKVQELITQPLEKIDIESVEQLAAKYSQKQKITELLQQNDYDAFVAQYRLLLSLETKAKLIEAQEEEEITILLMAT